MGTHIASYHVVSKVNRKQFSGINIIKSHIPPSKPKGKEGHT